MLCQMMIDVSSTVTRRCREAKRAVADGRVVRGVLDSIVREVEAADYRAKARVQAEAHARNMCVFPVSLSSIQHIYCECEWGLLSITSLEIS